MIAAAFVAAVLGKAVNRVEWNSRRFFACCGNTNGRKDVNTNNFCPPKPHV